MSYVSSAEFTEKKIFVKVVIEGKANLYIYEDSDSRKFFYDVDAGKTEQLIYKKYKKTEKILGTNNYFRQQLLNSLQCEQINENNLKNLAYRIQDLSAIFIKYNVCSNSKVVNYLDTQKKDLFNLSLRPGFSNSSFSIDDIVSGDRRDVDFGNQLVFRFGVELEFIAPFHKNKWAIIFEPTYNSFVSKKETSNYTFNVNYKSIELPIGIRHYFFLNETAKLFMNVSLVFETSGSSNVTFANGTVLDIRSVNNLTYGLGYKYDDRYILELRYEGNRDILADYHTLYSNFSKVSLILGYSFF